MDPNNLYQTLEIGRFCTAPEGFPSHRDWDKECSGTQFETVDISADGESGEAECVVCGYSVGVTKEGIVPPTDGLFDDSSRRGYKLHLKFWKNTVAFPTQSKLYAEPTEAEKFIRRVERNPVSAFGPHGATQLEMWITKDDVLVGETKTITL